MFLIAVLLLSACEKASFKGESQAAIKTAKATFDQKINKQNEKSGKIEFYLPDGYDLEEESVNNTILKNGSDTYILFTNPQEDSTSDVVYQSTVEQYKKVDINEKFSKDNKFAYLIIKQLDDDDMNELTIGIGGTKITTQTKTKNLEENAKVMMQIVHSVKYVK